MAQTMASSSSLFTATTTRNTTSPSLFKSFSIPLSTAFTAPFVSGSVSSDFSGHKLRSLSLTTSRTSSRPKRSVVAMVIPFNTGDVWSRQPPDLASYLLHYRIVYCGLALHPAVSELMLAEFLYLDWVDRKKPIFFYINSTGTSKGNTKYGYETEAFAIYDTMRFIKSPIYTLCVGNAWGEAALLLAAGTMGYRSALPSANIMLRQPIDRFAGQATDVELALQEMTIVKAETVKLLSKHIGIPPEEIEADIRRPKYFSPSEAVEYGIIDKVIYNERSPRDRRLAADQEKEKSIY